MNDKKNRLVLFAIDGATWEIIEMMLKQNKLPNFKKLMENGIFGALRSVNPPVTCPAWAVMFTGKNPATLGVYHFFKITTTYELKLSNMSWKKWRPLWDILSDFGKTTYTFNSPTTTAYKIKGKFISGPIWGEQDATVAYPEVLNEQLKHDKYQIRTEISDKLSGDDVYIDDVTRITENKFKVMYDHFKDDDWDLFIMSFYYCDQIQHRYWKYLNSSHPKFQKNSRFKHAIFDHYELLDRYLGTIIDNLPENTTIIVTSDHGHEPTHTYVNLNAWLLRKGFLKLKQDYQIPKKSFIKNIINEKFLKSFYFISQSYSKLTHFSKLKQISKTKNLRNKFKDWSYVIENKFSTKYPLKKIVDWNSTKAYSLIFNTIMLNLANREKFGVIHKKDHIKIRAQIIKGLKDLKDPSNNKKVIKNVWTKDQLFPSNPPVDFPDIFIQFHRGYRNYYSELHKPTELFSKTFKGSTEHYLDGIFLGYGPGIEVGKKIENARLEDIAPTILHILNCAIPQDIDGEVLKEIFRPGSEPEKRAIKHIRISETIKQPIMDRTKAKIRAVEFSKKI